jgi:hypothetical protein
MKRQLKPVKGALILGLVGTFSYACWSEVSETCLAPDTHIGYITGGLCNHSVYTRYTWWKFSQTFVSSGHSRTSKEECSGSAYYVHCETAQEHNIPGTLSYYEFGVTPHYLVNYGSPCQL